jgi:hypothetical protein
MIYFQDYADRLDMLNGCFNIICNKLDRMERKMIRIEERLDSESTTVVKPTPNVDEYDMPPQQPPEKKSQEEVISNKKYVKNSIFKGSDVSDVILDLESDGDDAIDACTSQLNLNLTPSSQVKTIGRALRFSSSPPIAPKTMPTFGNPFPMKPPVAYHSPSNKTQKLQTFGFSPTFKTPKGSCLGNKSEPPSTLKLPIFNTSPPNKTPQVQKRMEPTMENPLKKKQRSVPSTPKSKSTLKVKEGATQNTPKVTPPTTCGQTKQKVLKLLHVVTS